MLPLLALVQPERSLGLGAQTKGVSRRRRNVSVALPHIVLPPRYVMSLHHDGGHGLPGDQHDGNGG